MRAFVRLPVSIGLLAAVCVSGCRSTAPEIWEAGQTELEAGNPQAAIKRLEQSRRRDPDFAPTYLALAAAYSRQGDFDAVADSLEQYIARNPDHHVAHLYLAECLQTSGDLEGAQHHYLHFAHRTSPWNRSDLRRLTHTFHRLSDLAELRSDDFEASLYSGIASYYRGKELLASPDADELDVPELSTRRTEAEKVLDDARARLQAACNSRPDHPLARNYFAKVSRLIRTPPQAAIAAVNSEEATDQVQLLKVPDRAPAPVIEQASAVTQPAAEENWRPAKLKAN